MEAKCGGRDVHLLSVGISYDDLDHGCGDDRKLWKGNEEVREGFEEAEHDEAGRGLARPSVIRSGPALAPISGCWQITRWNFLPRKKRAISDVKREAIEKDTDLSPLVVERATTPTSSRTSPDPEACTPSSLSPSSSATASSLLCSSASGDGEGRG